MKKLFIIAMLIILAISSYTSYSKSQKTAKAEDKKLHLLKKKEHSKKKAADKKVKSAKAADEKKDNSLKISHNDKKLLAHLVHAEAKGEPFAGKVAVAKVVLNRVEHEEFPDTVKGVIYEKNAFSPVQNGSINEAYDKEAYKAVQVALANQQKDDELLYFYNPETATSDWIETREVIKTIGNHAFAI
ncbi:cell wall hydrolase [Niallia nealsonii]|uniref:Cell wall hydrolase n=1 Tax=Niallia nealsonii TaxID=115979 RepID=A0A2N0Z592_9BACI|nr:cell wall hydrolase [Niallia nealsonii]PKG24664.1 cell wall hydrolase [Niallia nealsonii]